ncbi:hypothetical protein M514_02349 [Trichuris suis]|uniref:Uncharacterized protein n=1 Tax=Trichuris suis TaxID=68888 RepID=A0A085MHH7_9BILA|nr:hypothetical protein M513_02349 [Trichuris suis]KFD66864.1 hypothetical protein M514_02349 [Trichuris suis]
MANAIKGSAVVEHSSQCSLDLRPKILCRESLFSLRKLKVAFYIRYNAPFMNRDKGAEVSKAWADLVNHIGCCASAPRPVVSNIKPQTVKTTICPIAEDRTSRVPKASSSFL